MKHRPASTNLKKMGSDEKLLACDRKIMLGNKNKNVLGKKTCWGKSASPSSVTQAPSTRSEEEVSQWGGVEM